MKLIKMILAARTAEGMKKALSVLMFGALTMSALSLVTKVNVRKIQPWNGLVEIEYNLTNTVTVADGGVLRTDVIFEDRQHGTNYEAFAFTRRPSYEKGNHKLIWDSVADGVVFDSTNVVCSVFIREETVKYCVVDLSGGPEAQSYPVDYFFGEPIGGWSDVYKTNKLVLRKIDAVTFTMGDQVHGFDDVASDISISNPYYIGVFEVTQRQWELVMGTRPSYFANDECYATRPVESVSHNMIRGSSLGAGWPLSSAVDPESFFGRLRKKTGLGGLDLPTEAQWECAARSGTSTDYGNNTNYSSYSQDGSMDLVGRYWHNGGSAYDAYGDVSVGTAKVGLYAPNQWGLYDMHGNVWEWCLDRWTSTLVSGATDPTGASSGFNRIVRGGGWFSSAINCTSSYRSYGNSSSSDNSNGFRICLSPVRP